MASAQAPAELAQIVTMMTTEHYVLQGTRSTTLADMQERASMYLTSVSSALVALAFVGQVAKLGPAFVAFATVILPTLYVLGFLTYVRAIQQSIEDALLARGINRIRHWYTEMAPEIARYLVLSTHDDLAGLVANMGIRPTRRQRWFTSEASIAFVNSVLLGALFGIVAALALRLSVGLSLLLAAVAFAGSAAMLMNIATRMWSDWEARTETKFPTPNSPLGRSDGIDGTTLREGSVQP